MARGKRRARNAEVLRELGGDFSSAEESVEVLHILLNKVAEAFDLIMLESELSVLNA
ncbi:hypothetical protein CAOG_009892 [Capsaspora owczarzaki ATCC 30864]|uniref:Uncharacterized protein n=1 Tax=Capsaspora owczarzaki (strain ATCC 30864) TaxID=595528 RepID=A0A0D2X407_CAPO3|nr:hypothetical protein CAOG_009892 [Capsaspora owczarzaki ATCC 30864]